VDEIETVQYLTFTMADELVVVDGSRVREILELAGSPEGTLIPDYMQGVFNLRGCPVPVIDLHLKLTVQDGVQPVGSFNISVELEKSGESVVLSGLTESGQDTAETKQFQVDAAPHWLRCRLNRNEFKALFSNFINLPLHMAQNNIQGDKPWLS
jgi:chemotaxis signal transduction protein